MSMPLQLPHSSEMVVDTVLDNSPVYSPHSVLHIGLNSTIKKHRLIDSRFMDTSIFPRSVTHE